MYGVPDTGYSLEEYWETLQIAECAAYGIRNFPGQSTISKGCGSYWQQYQRHFLATAIAKAEKRLSQDRWLGFPIRRTYYQREYDYEFRKPLGVRWVRCVGVHTTTIIGENYALTLDDGGGNHYDPVTITQAVSTTDPDEIVLFYADQTKYQIRPSSVTITGGVATILVPRCRLLDPDYFIDYDSDADRPDYDNNTYFIRLLDVAWDYCKEPGGNLVWTRCCPCCGGLTFRGCCCAACGTICEPEDPCGEKLQYACGYVHDQKLGIAQFEPVDLAEGGTYTATSYEVCRQPDKLQVQFMAGYHDRYDEVDEDLARALIAVAHNNMPEDVCGCAMQEKYFKRDVKAIEPAVSLGLGPSTWGIHEASQIVAERRVMGGAFL